jgi:myo-inositol 2-dehydrogenase / D-chiro-inositol 1-dehydrogenase
MAEKKGLSIVSGLQSRFHKAGRRRSSASTTGRSATSWPSSRCSSAARTSCSRVEGMSELLYQFHNWYHFCWLSGDDVIQSLVHNMDRASWILKEEMPKWAFGLAGRSSSFGEVYGDMFDHHTVVYEYASGPRVYALCRTQAGCYNNSSDIVMGTKGRCYLGNCRIEGETNWQYPGPHNNPYDAEQKGADRRGPRRASRSTAAATWPTAP